MAKIETSGSTYCTKRHAARPAVVLGRAAAVGASDGFSVTRIDDVGDEGDASRISPGTTPPISSFEIEMPES